MEAKKYAGAVRDFVSGGGRYLGFCLGAYLAGSDPGFDLLVRRPRAHIHSPGLRLHIVWT